MATKKPAKTSPKKLQNLAATPPTFDEPVDDQLVDHSGVFRVTAAIQRDQVGHGDETTVRFANDSLVMAAQASGFPEDGPVVDDEQQVDDEATATVKRQRLATLAALAETKRKR